ncbi:MAG: GNAT family N-acetyltransferase [Candidatus Zixiibacteriota bacterium]|nr:MAG: GNAT family N-acetyltransferase [candidate division Zixibacteria bacterium]
MAQETARLREQMLSVLPLEEKGFSIRLCERGDLDQLAVWPEHPAPYEAFDFSFVSMDPHERDILFRKRELQEDRITLIMDHQETAAIGYAALHEIDWNACTIGNMGVRLHPGWCDKGVGTFMISRVADWCFTNGITRLRLDVAAANHRAVRCYEKVGFIRTGEFWRKDEKLKGVNLSEAQHDFLREHLRVSSGIPEIRFWWMELEGERT